ncbi:MAG: hypothetical protein CBE06_000055 [Pelagibacteraceae bacterium TMED246]|nr:MAG: hypothetical protein CBE06_000055 [Pelagibacteraceae bacterium TMED246]|tara:strand:- start:8778 stop:9452 length:675 start_codon:yes stop_codon:yes gene_type:complete
MEIKNIIYIFFLTLILSYKNEHIVSMFSIPMANVKIEKKDTIFNNINSTKLTFKTHTNKFTSRLFRVENEYETIINNNNQSILSFKKSTYQPNTTNELETILINDTLTYKNSDKKILENYFNIFSLLHYLEITPYNQIEPYKIIDREGLLYRCNIKKSKSIDTIELNLDFDLINDLNDAVIEHTDLFTWALFKDNATNKIIIKNSKIESCSFKSGLANLKSSIK